MNTVKYCCGLSQQATKHHTPHSHLVTPPHHPVRWERESEKKGIIRGFV